MSNDFGQPIIFVLNFYRVTQVSALEAFVFSGSKVPEKEILLLEELLMRQLLKLDGIVAEEKAKELRKLEVSTLFSRFGPVKYI